MSSGLEWSVRLQSGATLTMLPPGVADGAQTDTDCFRQLGQRNGYHKQGDMRDSTPKPSMLRGSPGMGTQVMRARNYRRA